MKKSNFLLFIVGTLVFSLSACNTSNNNSGGSSDPTPSDPTPGHQHTFSSSWNYDSEYHWHDSTCGHDVVSNKEKHLLEERVVSPTETQAGYTIHNCRICSYSYKDNETPPIPSTKYTITWKNYDGSTLFIDSSVVEGTIPQYKGATPTRISDEENEYSFSGWTPTVVAAYSDATYTATFTSEIHKYTITWKNYDGTILEIDENVPYGTMPSYDGSTPSKPSTPENRFVFSSWSPTVASVTCDAIYTASFIATGNDYLVLWKNYDGTILETDENVPYGTMPSYDGSTPIRPSDNEFKYVFSNWYPEVSLVTTDVVYTAQYTSSDLYNDIQSIDFESNQVYMPIGEERTINYSTIPSKLHDSIIFKSYDSSIARVENNTIHGVSAGKTKIIGYGENGVFNVFEVNVLQIIEYIGVYNLFYGWTNTLNLPVDCSFSLRENLSVYPNNTSARYYTLRCYSDSDLITIDETGNNVRIHSNKGVAEVRLVYSSPLNTIENIIKLNISYDKILPESLTISKTEATITCGNRLYLSPSVSPSNANVGTAISYFSSDESVVSTEGNNLTGVGIGRAVVTVQTNSGLKQYCNVEVTGTYATSFYSTTPSSLSVAPNETKSINAHCSPYSSNVCTGIEYFSNDETVAFVDAGGNVTGITRGECDVIMTIFNKTKKTVHISVVGEIYPTSLSLSSTTISLKPNKSQSLTATISPSNANVCTQVTWSSSDMSIATVSVSGYVRTVAPGSCVITASLENGVSATCDVTVLDYTYPTSINLSSSSLSLDPLSSKTITASVLPSDADIYKTVSWASSNESVATVLNGVIAGLTPGSCVITASLENGVSATCDVTVLDYTYPTSITLSQSSLTIDPGKIGALAPIYSPSNSNNGLEVEWSSSDRSVATVENGVVTGISPGICVVTATIWNGYSVNCNVTVKDYVYGETITLSNNSVSIRMESTYSLTGVVLPSNSNIGNEISYNSTDSSIATVDETSGLIIAVGVGTCDIIASLPNGFETLCSVTVLDYIYAETLTLSKITATLSIGQSTLLTYTINPSNSQRGKDVVWSSRDENVATVNDGRVVGIAPGTCYIDATLENGFVASCQITVNDVSPIIKDAETYEEYSYCTYLNLTVNETRRLKSNTIVAYSSTDQNVAFVDSDGVLRAVGIGNCTIKATNSSNGIASFEVRVFDCSISFEEKYEIENYYHTYNDSLNEYQKGEITSTIEVSIKNYSFDGGKLLKMSCDIKKITGEFETPICIIFEIRDSNGNLLCKKFERIDEYILFGQTINTEVEIDLSNYYLTDYSHCFSVIATDCPLL